MTSYMNTSSKLYDYILAIWKKFNDLRDVLDPLWVELIRQLLSFALSLSKYNGAINQWLLSDIVVRNVPIFVVYIIIYLYY
jgi:hypothetical protein